MWKSVVGSLLILVGFIFFYEARVYWDQLTTWQSFIFGAASGGCLTAALFLLFWRPTHPAARYKADHPSPWNRGSWR
jgi:cyanate permease